MAVSELMSHEEPGWGRSYEATYFCSRRCDQHLTSCCDWAQGSLELTLPCHLYKSTISVVRGE